jgi:hypothetical protein
MANPVTATRAQVADAVTTGTTGSRLRAPYRHEEVPEAFANVRGRKAGQARCPDRGLTAARHVQTRRKLSFRPPLAQGRRPRRRAPLWPPFNGAELARRCRTVPALWASATDPRRVRLGGASGGSQGG